MNSRKIIKNLVLHFFLWNLDSSSFCQSIHELGRHPFGGRILLAIGCKRWLSSLGKSARFHHGLSKRKKFFFGASTCQPVAFRLWKSGHGRRFLVSSCHRCWVLLFILFRTSSCSARLPLTSKLPLQESLCQIHISLWLMPDQKGCLLFFSYLRRLLLQLNLRIAIHHIAEELI